MLHVREVSGWRPRRTLAQKNKHTAMDAAVACTRAPRSIRGGKRFGSETGEDGVEKWKSEGGK